MPWQGDFVVHVWARLNHEHANWHVIYASLAE